MALPGTGSPVAWWVIPTTYTNSSGQPGASYMIVTGTGTEITAKYGTVPNVLGPYATKADAQAAANDAVSSGKIGVQKPYKGPSNPLKGLAAIGDFFQRLTQGNTWIRAGEVLLGVILLAIGVARVTGTQNLISSAVKARMP